MVRGGRERGVEGLSQQLSQQRSLPVYKYLLYVQLPVIEDRNRQQIKMNKITRFPKAVE